MNNNNILFLNIIKKSGPEFRCREELMKLHVRALQLESSIKLRKDMEYEYNKLKIEELKERQDEFNFQKKFYIKRNKDILDNIEKNKFTSFELASSSHKILEDIQTTKNNYQNYLNNILPRIEVEFNTQLFSQNLLMMEKNKEENKLEENKTKNNYYEQLMIKNENLAREIKQLKKQNYLLSLKNQEKEQLFLEKEQNLLNQINNFDPNDNTLFQNKFVNEINNFNNNNDMNDNNIGKDENINLKRNDARIEQRGKLLMQYILNRDHNYGRLDEMRQKEIDIENEQLRNDFYQSKKKDNLIYSSRNSLDDLRRQIIAPKKQINVDQGMSGTLNQDFDNSGKNNQNNNKRNLDNNMSVVNSNNNKINKDNNMSVVSNFNQRNNNINKDNNMSVISNFGGKNNNNINKDNNMSVISNFGGKNNNNINKDNNMSVVSNFEEKNNIKVNKDNNMSVKIGISKNTNYDEPPTPEDININYVNEQNPNNQDEKEKGNKDSTYNLLNSNNENEIENNKKNNENLSKIEEKTEQEIEKEEEEIKIYDSDKKEIKLHKSDKEEINIQQSDKKEEKKLQKSDKKDIMLKSNNTIGTNPDYIDYDVEVI